MKPVYYILCSIIILIKWTSTRPAPLDVIEINFNPGKKSNTLGPTNVFKKLGKDSEDKFKKLGKDINDAVKKMGANTNVEFKDAKGKINDAFGEDVKDAIEDVKHKTDDIVDYEGEVTKKQKSEKI